MSAFRAKVRGAKGSECFESIISQFLKLGIWVHVHVANHPFYTENLIIGRSLFISIVQRSVLAVELLSLLGSC